MTSKAKIMASFQQHRADGVESHEAWQRALGDNLVAYAQWLREQGATPEEIEAAMQQVRADMQERAKRERVLTDYQKMRAEKHGTGRSSA